MLLLPQTYTRENLKSPAYQLRFSWTCWPSKGSFPPLPSDEFFGELEQKWEEDGIRRLETLWTPEQIQMTVSVKPHVTPIFLTSRLKGRLQFALRNAGTPVDFSRKLSLNSVGDVRRCEVEAYIRDQVASAHFADPRVEQLLSRFTKRDSTVDLAVPTETSSGRYWYNLHLVLIAAERFQTFDEQHLQSVCNDCFTVAEANGYGISIESIMPEHLHVALRGNINQSAEDIALEFLNNLARTPQTAPWEFGYYAGTFGEYDMWAVRA